MPLVFGLESQEGCKSATNILYWFDRIKLYKSLSFASNHSHEIIGTEPNWQPVVPGPVVAGPVVPVEVFGVLGRRVVA